MNKQIDKLVFSGREVIKNYYAVEEPFITHGLFRIQNTGEVPQQFSVGAVSCVIDKRPVEVPVFYLYKLPDYEKLGQESITVKPKETIEIRISFPQVSVAGASIRNLYVETAFLKTNLPVNVRSPYRIIIRTKKHTRPVIK